MPSAWTGRWRRRGTRVRPEPPAARLLAASGDALIKRLTFSVGRDALGALANAPEVVRPRRVTFCRVLPDLTPAARHDSVGIEWFDDDAHLARCDAWRGARGADVVVVATEHTLRGGEWLERRWREGGEKVKHMAIATRAAGLTPAQFSDKWLGRAGKVGATAIPDDAKGLAYVQNHPVPRDQGEWAYDAINEVYFDDVGGLQRRINWFAATLGNGTDDDLVSESWFLAVREEVLC